MNADASQNLSERLFSQQNTSSRVVETSTISNSNPLNEYVPMEQNVIDGLCSPAWYRVLRRIFWIRQGADPIELESVLAKIATSTNPRTYDQLLDTVQGFVPGNWSYEWSQLAGQYQRQGKDAEDSRQYRSARKYYFQAACYYSLASYPHLRGDVLAEQAQVLANKAYRDGGRLLSIPLKEIEVPFHGKNIKGYLHLPHDDHVVPVMMVTGAMDTLQIDHRVLFEKVLAPLGIAMLSLDLPGCGYASTWPLIQDTSRLHQAVLHHLKTVPWIDDQQIGMLGFRLGGNVAVRLAYLEPLRLKTVISIGAGVHQYFTNATNFHQSPPMMRACLANRLNMDAANWDELQKSCQAFSLKRQGLAGVTRTRVPILSIGHRRDFICPESDIDMLAASSINGKAVMMDKETIQQQSDRVFREISDWLRLHFSLL
jgi:esterase FrsA